jgi:multiple sugar transport system substrate-binding protein
MKKSLFFLSLLVIVSMLLVSCAPKATPQPTQPPEATKAEQPAVEPTKVQEPTATTAPVVETGAPVKIVIFVGFGTGTSPEQQAVHEQMAKEFNDSHKDIQIEFLTVPWEERITKYSTMIAGDMAPDIAMPQGVGGEALFPDEWLDLTPLIQKDNYDMTRFVGETPRIMETPGKGLLGMPLCVYPSVIYYNTDMFDTASVDYPPHEWGAPYADGQPWTYNKLVEVARKVTLDTNGNNADSPAFDYKNTKQWGWDGWSWYQGPPDVVVKFGAKNPFGMSDDFKTAEMNTQQAWINAFTFQRDAVWKYHIQATADQSGAFYDKAGDPFGSGLVAMWECHSWMANSFPAWTSAFNWDISVVPSVEGFPISATVDADVITIDKTSKHIDQAWEVTKWFLGKDIYWRLAQSYGCVPADAELGEKWYQEMQAQFPNVDFQVFKGSLQNIGGDMPNHETWRPEYTKVYDAIGKAQEKIMTGTNTDVQIVLDELNATVQGYLDDYWKNK